MPRITVYHLFTVPRMYEFSDFSLEEMEESVVMITLPFLRAL